VREIRREGYAENGAATLISRRAGAAKAQWLSDVSDLPL
jgi:hypothetical protein